MKNIAITLGVRENNESLWINGIKLNSLYLAKLLKNIGKYNVFFANTTSKDFTQYAFDTNEFPVHHISDVKDDIDILISLGGQIDQDMTTYLKNKKTKIVSYKCGNEYVIRMENVLFNQDIGNSIIWCNPDYDEIWCVPQVFEHNKYYFNRFHKNNNVKSVPFIWDSFLIDELTSKLKNNPHYTPKETPKTIAILEPNQDVLKYAMYPILIVDDVYEQRPELIEKLFVTNTFNIRKHKVFIEYMNHLSIVKNHMATFEDRFSTVEFLADYADIVVSHQWDNPLNYFYLDVAYLGHAILHNAPMCKNIGYYYEGFNGSSAADKLIWILENHDKTLDEYNEINKQTIFSYDADNEINISIYNNLLNNLIENY
jgi:DNA-dependent RNA polymerase auxiliary subunit epsilon